MDENTPTSVVTTLSSFEEASQSPAAPIIPPISSTEEAKAFLNTCKRSELRDHYFGDREIGWYLGDVEVASGYFGSTSQTVGIFHPVTNEEVWSCEGGPARELSDAGKLTSSERNDTEGPDRYQGY